MGWRGFAGYQGVYLGGMEGWSMDDQGDETGRGVMNGSAGLWGLAREDVKVIGVLVWGL